MLRHEITPSTSTESHGHVQLVAEMGKVNCASRGIGCRWDCRAGAEGQSRPEGSEKGARPKLVQIPIREKEKQMQVNMLTAGGFRALLERNEVSGDVYIYIFNFTGRSALIKFPWYANLIQQDM